MVNSSLPCAYGEAHGKIEAFAVCQSVGTRKRSDNGSHHDGSWGAGWWPSPPLPFAVSQGRGTRQNWLFAVCPLHSARQRADNRALMCRATGRGATKVVYSTAVRLASLFFFLSSFFPPLSNPSAAAARSIHASVARHPAAR